MELFRRLLGTMAKLNLRHRLRRFVIDLHYLQAVSDGAERRLRLKIGQHKNTGGTGVSLRQVFASLQDFTIAAYSPKKELAELIYCSPLCSSLYLATLDCTKNIQDYLPVYLMRLLVE